MHVAGAAGAVLQITGATTSDTGAYDCDVTNACGTVRTIPVALSVAGCAGDVNGDSRVDLSDLAAVLAVYGTTCD